MITSPSLQAALRDRVDNFIYDLVGSGAPSATTGVGIAGPGSTYTDTLTGVTYANFGTISVPVWVNYVGPVLAGIAGGAVGGGLGSVGNAKMTYVFAQDGGATTTITPTNSPTLPIGAIILGGAIDITTTLLGAGVSVALGFGSGAQVAALKAAAVVGGYTAGLTLALIPVFTAATYYKLTAAARMTLTVSGGTLTAGVMDVNVVYIQGN